MKRRFGQRRSEPIQHEDYLVTGRIVGPFGIRGEVKVEPYTDFPERFVPDAKVWVGAELQVYSVERMREHRGAFLLKLQGVGDRDAAEGLRGEWLYVPEADAMDLEQDEYYLHEVIGLEVWDEDQGQIGNVSDILFTGANDVYVVRKQSGEELLLPAIAEVVLSVDLEAGRLRVNLPAGL